MKEAQIIITNAARSLLSVMIGYCQVIHLHEFHISGAPLYFPQMSTRSFHHKALMNYNTVPLLAKNYLTQLLHAPRCCRCHSEKWRLHLPRIFCLLLPTLISESFFFFGACVCLVERRICYWWFFEEWVGDDQNSWVLDLILNNKKYLTSSKDISPELNLRNNANKTLFARKLILTICIHALMIPWSGHDYHDNVIRHKATSE